MAHGPDSTDRDRAERVKEILFGAVDLEGAERSAFLEAACNGDAALRSRVEGLLRAHESAGSLMAAPSRAGEAFRPSLEIDAGQRVGPFRIVRRLGEGGFGTVFLVEQERPVRRLAALKILKPGMDSRQVVARFEAERQAMALMEHPGIAKVLDAGTTPAGRPYFVMEYVDGRPVTEYCDAHRLSVRDRLELFRRICLAIQHAHQKGVVHRDLKPTNVLVAEVDGHAMPKVIDFGIAKAIGVELADHAVTTQAAQLLGTPEYMAPEQASLSGLDVDTRADVYSLGVLLYELLVGAAPFDRTRLRSMGMGDLERLIREEEPPRPSSRITALGAGSDALAAARRTDAVRLRRELRGDLDWIVMRAMEKDRARRYPAVNALADDIRRHLDDQPVEAGPPGALYRMRKFWRRHKIGASAALLVLLALVVTVAVSVSAAAIADHARFEAIDAERDAERNAYTASLLAASAALRLHDAATARWHLELAPASGRGWEWHHLRTVSDRSVWSYGPLEAKADALAASADGTRVALAAPDGTVRVLDASTGRETATLVGHEATVLALRFGLDGRLFSGDVAGTVIAWDTETGARLGVLEGHAGRVSGLALARDGRVLASAGWDGTVRTWDAGTLEPLKVLGPFGSSIESFAVDAALTRVAAALWDQTVVLVDAGTGETIARRAAARDSTPLEPPSRFPPARITAVAFDPHGRFAAVGTADGLVRVLDGGDGAPVATLDVGLRLVRALCVDGDGTTLAAGLIDGAVATWRMPGGEPLAELQGHLRDVRSLAFAPDGRLVSASFDGTVGVWNPRTGLQLASLDGHEGSLYEVDLPADGAFAVTRAEDGTVRRWDIGRGAADVIVEHDANVTAVAVSPDGAVVASGSADGTVRIHDLENGRRHARMSGLGSAVEAIAFAPDGGAVVVGLADGRVRLWRLDAKVPVRDLRERGPRIGDVAFSPDGAFVAAVAHDGSGELWRADSGSVVATLARHPGQAKSIAFTPDGSSAVTACSDGVVRVWRVRDGHLVREIAAPAPDGFECVAVSPDGRRLAFAGWGRVIRIADLATGRLLRTCRAHAGAVTGLAWLPDGSRIVSASRDRTVRVWDPDRGDAVAILPGHQNEVHAIAVAPDGAFVVSGGADGVVRIWRREPLR